MRLKQAVMLAGVVLLASVAQAQDTGLRERKRAPKLPDHMLDWHPEVTDRLIIKFLDTAKVRPTEAKRVRSEVGSNLTPVEAILEEYDLEFEPFIRANGSKFAALDAKLIARGLQPVDLQGMMYVYGPIETLSDAAKALNALGTVEFVEWDWKRYVDGDPANDPRGYLGRDVRPERSRAKTKPFGGGDEDEVGPPEGGNTGACCIAIGSCAEDLTATDCQTAGGTYLGDGTDCMTETCLVGICCTDNGCLDGFFETLCDNIGGNYIEGEMCDDGGGGAEDPCENDGCGDMAAGDCFDPDGNGTPYCDDDDCCNLICEFDPWCCDEENPLASWDEICASEGNLLCDTGEPCDANVQGNCFEAHNGGGCDNSNCCTTVCMMDQDCCDDEWDEGCVALAFELCVAAPIGPDDPSPKYTQLQGYASAAAYDPVPGLLGLPEANGMTFIGYDGAGFNVKVKGEPWDDLNENKWWDVGEPFVDEDGDGIWDEPAGIWGFAEKLLHFYGINATGKGNLTLGNHANIGIIEWGYWSGHEDLTHAILEPGQTLFEDEIVDEPNHGTACLGIVGAERNDFGMQGLVHEATPWFFPLTSVNEGPRESEAWFNALLEFDVGDVLSASYGPGPPIGNLNNSAAMWTIFRTASDLGIHVCVAAGNDCYLLDNAPDLGDSGAIVVGASSPGNPHYRLIFSNFCQEPDNERSNIVHLNAWGVNVATLGYGDLQAPDAGLGEGPIMERSYTVSFGGTSAACPQIASSVLMVQGLAKQFYGIAFLPEALRGLMGAPGVPPPSPAPRLFGGFDDTQTQCNLDLDPEEGPNMIGVFPNLHGDFGAISSVLVNQSGVGFDDAPIVDNFAILRGELIYGSFFSLKGNDGNLLRIDPEWTQAGQASGHAFGIGAPGGTGAQGAGFAIPQAQDVTYLATGDVADVVVVAHAGRQSTGSPPGTSRLRRHGGAHDPDRRGLQLEPQRMGADGSPRRPG